ncbi:nuclear transport factor 2 family protein [Cryomorphaceae bacterium 1068]|nr:nuclear transport factor 2 family protein [Cryomorphaceae bacterium 1068]
MKKLLFIFCFSASTLFAQNPVEVVQAQLDAYNSQDIESFAAVFAEDAKLYMNLGDTVPTISGRQEIKRRYGEMFRANPNNKSTLIGRMTQGNFVFDHEWITGRDKPLKIMAIYEVENGLIVRCWFPR